MQRLLLHHQSRTAIISHGTRSITLALASRQFSTTPLGLGSLCRNGNALTQSPRIPNTRNFWWSSKPAAAGENAPHPQSLPPQSSTLTPSEHTAMAGGQQSSFTVASGNASTAVPAEPASASVNTSNATIDALATDNGIAAAISEAARAASNDYSHLFSWAWPSGTFLRVTSWIQHMEWLQALELGTPIICLTLAVLFFRIPIVPLQWRAVSAQARLAPYQEELKSLMKALETAKQEQDQIKYVKTTERIQQIRTTTNMKPFSGLPPALLMLYAGIGSFLGAGRLVEYHREVVELGGVGPLSYPGGLFGTGILEDLTTFSPALLAITTATTWLNTRRGALDSPQHSKWLARMPSLMTPVTGIFGLALQFSAAQMFVLWIGLLVTLLQSYLRRVPFVKRLAGLEKAPGQDPRTYEFEPFVSSWRNLYKDAIAYTMERAEKQQRVALLERELRQVRMKQGANAVPTSQSSSVATVTNSEKKGQRKISSPSSLYNWSTQPPPRPSKGVPSKPTAKNASKGNHMSTWSK